MRDVHDVNEGVKEVATLVRGMGEELEQRMVRVLEARAAESGTITAQALKETAEGLKETMKAMMEPLYRRLPEAAALATHAAAVGGAALAAVPVAGAALRWPTYQWGGRLRRVPETFKLPPGNVRHAWQLWCLGSDDACNPHPPIRQLDQRDMGEESVEAQRNKRRKLSDLRSLMGKMESVRYSSRTSYYAADACDVSICSICSRPAAGSLSRRWHR